MAKFSDTLKEQQSPAFGLSENGSAPVPDFTDLEDFFETVQPTRESANIGGRMCYFEAGSPADKDKLFEAHTRNDGEGHVSADNKRWRTNVISMAWVKHYGGPRVLATQADSDRFYNHKGFAVIEVDMFEIAARVSGLGDAEKRRKNSDEATRTTSTSPSSA